MLQHDDKNFSIYPTKRVIAVIDEKTKADAAVKALESQGFNTDDIDASYGEDGLHFLDPDAKYHGIWPKVVRKCQKLANDEEKRLLDLICSELSQGDVLVSITAPKKCFRQTASQILRKFGAHDIRYYSQIFVEDLTC